MASRRAKSNNPFGDGGDDNDITSAFQRSKKPPQPPSSSLFPTDILEESNNPFDASIPTISSRKIQSQNPFADHYSPPVSPPSSRDTTPRKARTPFGDSPPSSLSPSRKPTPSRVQGSTLKNSKFTNPFGGGPTKNAIPARYENPFSDSPTNSPPKGRGQNPFGGASPTSSPSSSRNSTPIKPGGGAYQNPFEDNTAKVKASATSAAKPPSRWRGGNKKTESVSDASNDESFSNSKQTKVKVDDTRSKVSKQNSKTTSKASTINSNKSSDTTSLLTGMDHDDSSTTVATSKMSSDSKKGDNENASPSLICIKPNVKLSNTSSNVNLTSTLSSDVPRKSDDSSVIPSHPDASAIQAKKKKMARKKSLSKRQKKKEQLQKLAELRSKITRWPYDDFHKEQERYYLQLQESSLNVVKDDMNESSFRKSSDDILHSGSDDEDENYGLTRQKALALGEKSNDKLLERPDAPPSIKEDVHDLDLLRFEDKAKERAISIVNTWLFDTGLIDELLVYGGMNSSAMLENSSVVTSSSRKSNLSNLGIELGMHGFQVSSNLNEGGLKVDKELERFRASTQRELNVVNARLNDGVSASRAEVEDLVKAVNATKTDLGRLRELTTYISSTTNETLSTGNFKSTAAIDGTSNFFLAKYPRLKRVINARRNLFRCFRDLEFFSQIPATCDRLRDELHQGEWTSQEWKTIRNVCMEHVSLELLLIEAEAGMKGRIEENDSGEQTRNNRYRSGGSESYELVESFLEPFVRNVWELGDEIRVRIISGVGSAFDLAIQNPTGMVALVEAVEVYERAAEEYKSDNSEMVLRRNKLNFTDMRDAALAQLYQDFELRGLEVFRAIHMQAADLADEEDAMNTQFTAVLRAATELVTEIDVVKNQMAPCFPPHWHIEMLWSSCVAQVCSNQIIQQIGGPDGQSLPDLTVNQLLDLVAWVEFFRETIEETFPTIASMRSKKIYFDSRPDLFAGDSKVVNMANATDSLAWVNNMLWEVHRLAQDEFLHRMKTEAGKWLENVYRANHEKHHNVFACRLVTSLCEDVFSLASVQVATIRERLSRKSDALVMSVCIIFSHLRTFQMQYRDQFLIDLESCCAAANDFQRMSEKCEDLLQEVISDCNFPEESLRTLQESANEVLNIYSADAVFAAQSAHRYIFEPIGEAIGNSLFAPDWENKLTHNELALTLVKTLVCI